MPPPRPVLHDVCAALSVCVSVLAIAHMQPPTPRPSCTSVRSRTLRMFLSLSLSLSLSPICEIPARLSDHRARVIKHSPRKRKGVSVPVYQKGWRASVLISKRAPIAMIDRSIDYANRQSKNSNAISSIRYEENCFVLSYPLEEFSCFYFEFPGVRASHCEIIETRNKNDCFSYLYSEYTG